MTKSRICITGGGGYFGQCVADQLQKHGYHTVLLDLNFVQNSTIQLNSDDTTKIVGSVTDVKTVERALNDCIACLHIAAYGMSGSPSLNEHRCREVNVGGTEIVLSTCLQLGVGRLVYASTVGVVFTDKPIINGDENMPYAKPNEHVQYYTLTKSEAEQIVLKSNGQKMEKANENTGETNLYTCALRLRGIYGPGEPRTTLRTVEMCRRGLLQATFGQSSECLTQYSGVENTTRAFRQAAETLGQMEGGRAAGNAYFIVDGGPPVDGFGFFKPLIQSLDVAYPRFRLPYILIYYLSFLMELLYHLTGIEPLLTRLEVNLIGIPNYYSIENAKRDIGYRPTNNHDLTSTIAYFKKEFEKNKPEEKGSGMLGIIVGVLMAGFALYWIMY